MEEWAAGISGVFKGKRFPSLGVVTAHAAGTLFLATGPPQRLRFLPISRYACCNSYCYSGRKCPFAVIQTSSGHAKRAVLEGNGVALLLLSSRT